MKQSIELISRWRKRNVITNEILDFYGIDNLQKFLKDFYFESPRKIREAITCFIKSLTPLSLFTVDFALSLKTQTLSDNAKRGHQSLITRVGKEEISNIKRSAAFKGQEKRINRYPSLSNEQALKQSYIDALETKGKKIAAQLGLPGTLSSIEYLKLSGFSKRDNFSRLSEEEKEERCLTWKIQNLKNEKVATLLSKFNPEFKLLVVDLLSPTEINDWYSEYCSLLSSFNIQKSKPYSSCKSGYYTSIKTNKTYYHRSSYELLVYRFLDVFKECIDYDVEPYHIKLETGKRYVPDIVCKMDNGKTIIFEIKPDYKVEEFLQSKGNLVQSLYGDCFHILTTKLIEGQEKLNEYFIEHFTNK